MQMVLIKSLAYQYPQVVHGLPTRQKTMHGLKTAQHTTSLLLTQITMTYLLQLSHIAI